MSAGDRWQYLWCDGVKVKKPIAVSAPQYVDHLMTWVESQLNDEDIFPIKFDAPFPKKFQSICATIYKRFFRIYAHIYHQHINQIENMQAATHLNTCFKHVISDSHTHAPAIRPSVQPSNCRLMCCVLCVRQFIYFVDEFQLVSRDEQAPLRDLIDNIYRKSGGGGGGTGTTALTASSGRVAGVAGSGPSHDDTLTKEQDVLAK